MEKLKVGNLPAEGSIAWAITVWNVYAGTIGCFCMTDPVRFVVRDGEAVPNA